MRYISTRQTSGRAVSFERALLQGPAPDGGLYLPERWPALDAAALEALRGRPYAEVAAAVAALFTGRAFSQGQLARIAAESYAGFDHPATAPLIQLGPDRWLLELFHGPTLAFKDFALQMVARMLDAVLARRGRTATILAATSGDTGAAAIEAFRGREAVSIVVLHPAGRVSEMQRRQMTCAPEPNVHNVAIAGTFDDCQALVKALFADAALRDEVGLAAVNSINWARVAAQTAYYVYAALALGAPGRSVSFVVPTGNFGNVYAGYAARQMGVPIERLVVATNRNDILACFFESGLYAKGEVHRTLSPSMDIQVASNFERLLADLSGRDGAAVRALMAELAKHGRFTLKGRRLGQAQAAFAAARADDDACIAAIADVWRESGRMIDPHSAAGVHAARRLRSGGAPVVSLATAHAAKFPDAIERAIGVRPAMPPRLAALAARPERVMELPADAALLTRFIRERVNAPRRERVA
ncbi:MAG: threonine synthase [Rhodospirillales bacterium]|nr:threonine synthase [Rhodospirillales bacterium]MDE0379836.1 threonine synthase [Rhodospirillales bacterium]